MPATTKGMFFNVAFKLITAKGHAELIEKISKKLGKPLKYIDFFDYPIEEFMLIVEEAIKYIYPDKKFEEALYILSEESFDLIMQTPIIKAVLSGAKKNMQNIAKRIPFIYEQFNHFGKISIIDLKEKNCVIAFKNYKTYPELQQGFLQRTFDFLKLNHTVELNIHKFKNNGNGDITADFDISLKWG
ncbi:MAG: DUF2378 family protein [Candidatus Omnitrophota bacterium]